MKKYIIKYITNNKEGEAQYPWSSNGCGGSYAFTTKEDGAQRFYGDIVHVGRTLATRIFNDAYCFINHYIALDDLDETMRSRYWYQGYEIIEVDEEPADTFEIRAALRKFYRLEETHVVEDAFKFDRDQERYQERTDIKIYNLTTEDLKNYYQWVKRNFKAKKEVSKLDALKIKVEYYLEKLKTKYNKNKRAIGIWGAHL